MNVGDMIYIQSFKHNGQLHRTWSMGTVLEASAKQWVVVTYKTLVVDSDVNSRVWQTREPAICFFYPDRWYNIIAMIRKSGLTFYCNIASPTLYDGEALKNIDYDLDLKVFHNWNMEVLDEDEFEKHSKLMHYSVEVKTIVRRSLQQLIQRATQHEAPFNQQLIESYYLKFLSLDRQRLK